MEVRKTNGTIEEFDLDKVKNGICEAYTTAGEECEDPIINAIVSSLYIYNGISTAEIRRQVEDSLMSINKKVAKAYIEKNCSVMELKKRSNFISDYIEAQNASTGSKYDSNANVSNKNIATLNAEIPKRGNIEFNRDNTSNRIAKLYSKKLAKQYKKDLEDHIIYKHDESSFGVNSPYCVAIQSYPFLTGGLKGLGGLSSKPKNLDSFCGMFVNLIFAVSSQFAGAVASSGALLMFDYFARKEWGDDYYLHTDEFCKIGIKMRRLINESHYWSKNIQELKDHDFGSEELNSLRDEIVEMSQKRATNSEIDEYIERCKNEDYTPIEIGDGTRTIGSQIEQYFQQIVYSINQPAAARGFQSAFTNFGYFDKPYFEGMYGTFVFPDGTKPCWESLSFIQKKFMKWFNKERTRCVLTFPVETMSLLYKDGKFVDEEYANFTAEMYAEGHSFFTYISDSPDTLSSCCRLSNKIQENTFSFTNGLTGEATGSKSVITLNYNRIIQNFINEKCNGDRDYWKKSPKKFKEEFGPYLIEILERVYKYHTAYNDILWELYEAHMLPVYSAGFIHLNKQYLTLGLNGLNEAWMFLGGKCRYSEDYKDFCRFIEGTMKEQNTAHRTKKTMFNSEFVPAESLGIKNYKWDKADGYWVPEGRNCYTSYFFLPDDDIDLFEKMKLHGKEFVENLDGGSACHINLKEHCSFEQYRKILDFAGENGTNYFTFNVKNTECKDCGYISKHDVDVCPRCGSHNLEKWTRIIGYLVKVSAFNAGRQIEEKKRVYQIFKDMYGCDPTEDEYNHIVSEVNKKLEEIK